MKRVSKPSDIVFQTSWEVCNKVGGIYTVLSTQAKVLSLLYKDNLIYIGPDLNSQKENPLFFYEENLYKPLRELAAKEGIPVRFGRWQIPGKPVVALVDFQNLFAEKDAIYAEIWSRYKVDSLHAYGDYDEACMFSYMAGKLAVLAYNWLNQQSASKLTAVFQAHEWMSGFGLLYVKMNAPSIGTVFTTHATSVGRSITTNNKNLYEYFDGYYGDQMATELNMQSKHSIEKAAALEADCLTTVSEVTDRECKQFFGRKCDIILPNGFDPSFVVKGAAMKSVRTKARKALLNAYNALSGSALGNETLIVSTSGRNDFRCKGFDLFLSALSLLEKNKSLSREVLAVIAVPCWKKEARKDLQERLKKKNGIKILDATECSPLPHPFITHELYNFESEKIVSAIYNCGLSLSKNSNIHLLFIPSYLDGQDGIINMPYYDFLTASDYCIYPSYYEPWGYTPLESIAFGIPCLTTNLSGFGQWVNTQVGHQAILSDGVAVIQRTDNNYEQCACEIAVSIQGLSMLSDLEYINIQEAARKLSLKAQWKDFIKYYLDAYTLSLKYNATNRQ